MNKISGCHPLKPKEVRIGSLRSNARPVYPSNLHEFATHSRFCFAIFVIVFWAVNLTSAPRGGELVQQDKSTTPVVKSCIASDSANSPKSKPAKHRGSQQVSAIDSGAACVEVQAEILQVQEYLQAWIRDLHWKITNEHTNENSWDFSRDLTLEELLDFTRPDRRPGGIEWRSGSTTVQITTTEIENGFARTIIRAQFRGVGETTDKLATPHEWYQLESNGALETSIVEAVKKHFGAGKT